MRALREKVTSALQASGFEFDPGNRKYRDSRNESRYTLYQLPYPAETRGDGALRAEIKIETAVWPLRLAPVTLRVTSFLAQAFNEPPEIPSIVCASLIETLAEKFVALTRRVGEGIANPGTERDKALVRHIYDLHVTRAHYTPAELVELVAQVVQTDAQAYGNKFPAYRENPIRETLAAVDTLTGEKRFADLYGEFLRDMVYGVQPTFNTAVGTIRELAEELLCRQP